MPKPIVLDSSAVLAVTRRETGAAVVRTVLDGSLLCAVNAAEVHERMLRDGAHPVPTWNRILNMGCEICPFTPEQARMAAELTAITRPYGLSLGDRACLALAIERKATVYTADRAWKELGLGVEVEVIG